MTPFLAHLCDLDEEIQLGLTVTAADITEREFRALIILQQEKNAAIATRAERDKNHQAARRLTGASRIPDGVPRRQFQPQNR